jgi:hypothetical protein
MRWYYRAQAFAALGKFSMPVLPSADAEMERQIVEIIGTKLAGILKEKTPSRICGLLTAKGRSGEWEAALEHISSHFGPMPDKSRHNIFRKKFRDADTLKKYVKQAASGPSLVRLSRLRDGYAEATGTPCLLIIREFQEPVGEEPVQVFLVIVADFQSKLVTTFPPSKKQVFG